MNNCRVTQTVSVCQYPLNARTQVSMLLTTRTWHANTESADRNSDMSDGASSVELAPEGVVVQIEGDAAGCSTF